MNFVILGFFNGKYGVGVNVNEHLLNETQRKKIKLGWVRNEFNQFVSDLIPLNRDIGEVRELGCNLITYRKNLPDSSVIICFHNEAWSTLLRTVHSVLRHTPLELLREVILVDDFSTFEHLKKPLEIYIQQLPKVRVIRTAKREGLIRARLIGYSAASGQVLTYLDSHCECAKDWLRPMLQRIAENPKAVVVPVIDNIDDTTFSYMGFQGDGINVGIFHWNMLFNWMPVPKRIKDNRKSRVDPIFTPTIAGGLFSIRKDFFTTLGTYDPGFDTWGGENLELSFKTWMCGGSLEIMPCSHVGHIYRKKSPYVWPKGYDVIRKNSVRLAEVWLDDYKDTYFRRIGNSLGNYGDVSQRKKLREQLQCKSFDWYLNTIFPEALWIKGSIIEGRIMNGLTKECLYITDVENEQLRIMSCLSNEPIQHIVYTRNRELRGDTKCFDASDKVVTLRCHGFKGNQEWEILPTNQIFHIGTRLCLEPSNQNAVLNHCSNSPLQVWFFFKDGQVQAPPFPQQLNLNV